MAARLGGRLKLITIDPTGALFRPAMEGVHANLSFSGLSQPLPRHCTSVQLARRAWR